MLENAGSRVMYNYQDISAHLLSQPVASMLNARQVERRCRSPLARLQLISPFLVSNDIKAYHCESRPPLCLESQLRILPRLPSPPRLCLDCRGRDRS